MRHKRSSALLSSDGERTGQLFPSPFFLALFANRWIHAVIRNKRLQLETLSNNGTSHLMTGNNFCWTSRSSDGTWCSSKDINIPVFRRPPSATEDPPSKGHCPSTLQGTFPWRNSQLDCQSLNITPAGHRDRFRYFPGPDFPRTPGISGDYPATTPR